MLIRCSQQRVIATLGLEVDEGRARLMVGIEISRSKTFADVKRAIGVWVAESRHQNAEVEKDRGRLFVFMERRRRRGTL